MREFRLLVIATVALLSSPIPSIAGNPNIDRHMYHAPQEWQLINNGPTLMDLRRQGNTSQVYVIEAPQATQPAAPPITVGPGGQNGSAPAVTFSKPSLPPAGLQSNISANPGSLLTKLPNGMSTNMLAGRMLSQGPKSVASTPAATVPTTSRAASIPAAPKTLVYTSQPSSSGIQSRNVSTAVTGQIQRGSLLAHH